jgi:hypothetical protein
MSDPADLCWVSSCRRKATTRTKFRSRITWREMYLPMCAQHNRALAARIETKEET